MILFLAMLGLGIVVSVVLKSFPLGIFGFVLALVGGPLVLGENSRDILKLFPTALFLQLLGLFLFFAVVEESGVLNRILARLTPVLFRFVAFVPFFVFFFAASLSALGLGNIAALALLAPLGMGLAERLKMPPFLMVLVLVGGANAASLSPLGTAGVMVHSALHKMTLEAQSTPDSLGLWSFVYVFGAITFVTFFGFFACGGLKWIRNCRSEKISLVGFAHDHGEKALTTHPGLSKIVLVAVFCVAVFSAGKSFFAKSESGSFELWTQWLGNLPTWGWVLCLVSLTLKWIDSEKLFRRVSWSVLFMILGMAFCMEVLVEAGFASQMVNWVRSSEQLNLLPVVLSVSSGLLSTFSSSTGVVLPLFLPVVQELHQHKVGGFLLEDSLLPMLFGSHLVDASPLSTLGALCVAAASGPETRKELFRKLLIWGFCMIPVAGIVSYFSAKWLF